MNIPAAPEYYTINYEQVDGLYHARVGVIQGAEAQGESLIDAISVLEKMLPTLLAHLIHSSQLIPEDKPTDTESSTLYTFTELQREKMSIHNRIVCHVEHLQKTQGYTSYSKRYDAVVEDLAFTLDRDRAFMDARLSLTDKTWFTAKELVRLIKHTRP